MEVQRRRLCRALLILVAAFGLMALSAAATREFTSDAAGTLVRGEGLVRAVLSDVQNSRPSSSSAIEDELDRVGVNGPERAPSWFEEEVVPLDPMRDVRANEAWTVVGFAMGGKPEAAQAQLAVWLQARGWTLLDSGVPGVLTGAKEGGEISWLMLSCMEASDGTYVVMQVSAA